MFSYYLLVGAVVGFVGAIFILPVFNKFKNESKQRKIKRLEAELERLKQ